MKRHAEAEELAAEFAAEDAAAPNELLEKEGARVVDIVSRGCQAIDDAQTDGERDAALLDAYRALLGTFPPSRPS